MENGRFTFEKHKAGFVQELQVITDTATGVQYLFVQSGYAGGLTALVDKDGKPILAKPRAEG